MLHRYARWILLPLMVLWLAIGTVVAQRNKLQFLRVYEDNDAFNPRNEVTDREYTNGAKLDIFYTKHAKPRFLSALLIPIAGQVDNLYGVGLTQLMFTPADITRKDISYGDRPYTGVLFFSHSLASSDHVNHQKLTTELGLGVLGRASLAGETQIWIHKNLGFTKPEGWDHQLPTDVMINYMIQYEKLVVQPSPNLEIIGLLGANVGTLYNNLNVGLTFRAGLFSDYFSNYERPAVQEGASHTKDYRRFQFFFFMRPTARLVMDDSMLQGGFFTHDRAEYVMDRDLINRANIQFEYGFILGYNRFGVSFSEKLRTAEFSGGPNQQIGNLTLFIGL